jgi:hypothetical protein
MDNRQMTIEEDDRSGLKLSIVNRLLKIFSCTTRVAVTPLPLDNGAREA